MSAYDGFAASYDAFAPGGGPDVAFYVEQAERAGGPIVELGPGTGRVAVPTAVAGVRVIGVDASAEMLAVCRRHAEAAGVADLLDLRVGDWRDPPVEERVRLVTCPFRSFQHLLTDADRRRALAAVHRLLEPGGRFVFDAARPNRSRRRAQAPEWVERAPGMLERDTVDWDRRLLEVEVRTPSATTALSFAWLERDEWRELFEEAGFTVTACYGGFDLRPCAERLDHLIWVVERPVDGRAGAL